jgi:hypothetical protein
MYNDVRDFPVIVNAAKINSLLCFDPIPDFESQRGCSSVFTADKKQAHKQLLFR